MTTANETKQHFVIHNNKESSSNDDNSRSSNHEVDDDHNEQFSPSPIQSSETAFEYQQNKESNTIQNEDDEVSQEEDGYIDDFFANSNINNLLTVPGDSEGESEQPEFDDTSQRLQRSIDLQQLHHPEERETDVDINGKKNILQCVKFSWSKYFNTAKNEHF